MKIVSWTCDQYIFNKNSHKFFFRCCWQVWNTDRNEIDHHTIIESDWSTLKQKQTDWKHWSVLIFRNKIDITCIICVWWWWWLGGGRNSKFYMMFKPNKCRFWNEIQIKIESEKKWKLTTTRGLYQWNLCVCEFKTASRMSKMKKEKKFDNRY